MNDDTFQRILRARPPADPVYQPRFGAGPRRTAVARPASPSTSRLGTAMAMAIGLLLVAGMVIVVGSQILRSTPVPETPAGFFSPAGEMSGTHGVGLTATVLADGRVLVVGGEYSPTVTSVAAEVWDPATDTFASTGPMSIGRSEHTATLLPDGRVLVLGGWDAGSDTAEVWDPTTGTFGPLLTLPDDRRFSAVALLHDGRVLIVGGGVQDAADQPPAQIWDPATGTFLPVGAPVGPIIGQTATTLPDGRVLVVGGETLTTSSGPGAVSADARLWDPDTGSFAPTGSLVRPLVNPRAWLLPDGRVLVVGVDMADNPEGPLHAEVWDPEAGTFAELAAAAPAGTLALLPDGRMLVFPAPLDSNCKTGQVITTETQIWDPFTGAVTPARSFAVPRTDPVMTSLPDGRVLVLGGSRPRAPQPSATGPGCSSRSSRSVAAAEVWTPATYPGTSPGPKQ